MKQVLIIETNGMSSLVVPTESFRKEHCDKAIAKALKVNVKNIEQIVASTSYGIYGLKTKNVNAGKLATNPITLTNYYCTFKVNYGDIVE